MKSKIKFFLFLGLFFATGIGVVSISACAPGVAQKDFFECGPHNKLVACPVGQTPQLRTYGDCRAVGDGDTTLPDGACK